MAPHAWAAGPRKRAREDDYADAAVGGVSGFSEHRTVSRLLLLSRVISADVFLFISAPPLLLAQLLLDFVPFETAMSPAFDGMLTPALETPTNLACPDISQRQEMAFYTEFCAREPTVRRLRLPVLWGAGPFRIP